MDGWINWYGELINLRNVEQIDFDDSYNTITFDFISGDTRRCMITERWEYETLKENIMRLMADIPFMCDGFEKHYDNN